MARSRTQKSSNISNYRTQRKEYQLYRRWAWLRKCRRCDRSNKSQTRTIVIDKLVFYWRCQEFDARRAKLRLGWTKVVSDLWWRYSWGKWVEKNKMIVCSLWPMRYNIRGDSRRGLRSTSNPQSIYSLFFARSYEFLPCSRSVVQPFLASMDYSEAIFYKSKEGLLI